MRILLVSLICVGACGDDDTQRFHNNADFDAQISCDPKAYIVAPVAGEHYAPDLLAIASLPNTALAPAMSATIVDADGHSYASGPMTTTSIDSVGQVAEWRVALAPSGRYTLTVSGPLTYGQWCPQEVTFFTSPQ